jgi:peptidoglycan/xylan/chitin deacetylase (PgdA/CDA1 family)
MQYLDKNYTIISFEDFYHQFDKRRYPSDPTFIITFDDGKGSFFKEIFPVCEEISIPVMNYVTTKNIIEMNPFWWDEVKEIKKLGGNIEVKSFLSMTSRERRNILDELGEKFHYVPKYGDILSKEQILEMNKHKYVSFGSHSVSHTNLTLETEENIKFELSESKKYLEQLLQKEIVNFSYPNGDYNKNVISILKELGYKSSVTSADSWVSKNENMFEISRVGAGPYGCSRYWLEARISGTLKAFK